MIIGNGMMARTMREFNSDDSVMIFASGVSNSKEINKEAYQKEISLLQEQSHTKAKLVYFSTCSVFDLSLNNSDYVLHKKYIENYISQNFSNYLVIRLPNVIGKSQNPNTLSNFLFNAIRNDKSFELHEKAYRYFIDADDIKEILGKFIKSGKFTNGIYNLLFPEALNVKDLVKLMEEILEKKAQYILKENEGSLYQVKISEQFIPFLNFSNNTTLPYIKQVLQKYYLLNHA